MNLIKLAMMVNAYGRYSELQQKIQDLMRSGANMEEISDVWAANEKLKNQYGGMPPPGKMPDPKWQVTVNPAETFAPGRTMPGFIQVDDINGGQNRWSSNPLSLRLKGFKVPDGMTGLPGGKYSMLEALRRLWESRPSNAGGIPIGKSYPLMEAALSLSQYPRPKVTQGENPGISVLKAWRRYKQRVNPEFNQAVRRFRSPGALNLIKTLAAKL